MSVLILNITGNKVGFENDFSKLLCDNVENSTLIEARGREQFSKIPIDDFSTIVIIAHGKNINNDNTIIDTGDFPIDIKFTKGTVFNNVQKQLNSLGILLQNFTNKKSKKHIIVLCVCEGLSIQNVIDSLEDTNCIGIVATENKIENSHIKLISDIINDIESAINKEHIKIDNEQILQKRIDKIHDRYKNMPRFQFRIPIKVIEESSNK